MQIKKFFIPPLILSVVGIGLGLYTTHFRLPTTTKPKEALAEIRSAYNKKIFVDNTPLFIEIANTDSSRTQGLSTRAKLKDSEGMLFDFSNTNNHYPNFWMKDMKFDLDLIWIQDFTKRSQTKYKIIGITTNARAPKSPSEKLLIYSPPSSVTMVLEVNAGWSKQHKIKIGDEVNF